MVNLDRRHAVQKLEVFVMGPGPSQCQITEGDGVRRTAVYLPIPRALVEIWKKEFNHNLLVQDSYPIDKGSRKRLVDKITIAVNMTT